MSRLMLKKWFGVKDLKVQSVEMAKFRPNQTKPWEATLQFGDNALISPPTGMTVTDLGEEWFLRTQKPFIHAVWMARDVAIAREIETDLTKAKEEGLKHLDEIVEHYPGIWVFDRPKAKEYLQKNIQYDYGPEELKGQLEFERLLKEEGLI
jgi:chorismate dehydratase